MNVTAVAGEVRLVLGEEAEIVQFVERSTEPSSGLVMVFCPAINDKPYATPWVVWRWATRLTDGSPVRTATRAMLFSGGYYTDRQQADKDWRTRA